MRLRSQVPASWLWRIPAASASRRMTTRASRPGIVPGVGAWMSFDGLAHNDSRRLFRVAVGCLGEYDWHLRAMLLCDMARQEIWCGDPDTGPGVRGDGAGAGGSPHSHRAGDGQYRPGPPP